MGRKGNPSTLLVGMQTGAATVENGMEVSQKKKNKTELTYDPAIPLLGRHPKETIPLIQKDTCTPVFITALFTITKV